MKMAILPFPSLPSVSSMSPNKTVKQEPHQKGLSDSGNLLCNVNRRFDAYSLVQAKEELDSILTAQVTPIQCSQSLTVQLVFPECSQFTMQNPLPENLVRRFFSVAKGNTENVFKEKDFMEIIFWIAVVFASQENVDVNLQEDGLDLLLVESLASLLTTKEWFRHTKIGRNP
jgi:hypothetical protein